MLFGIERDGLPRRPARDEARDAARDLTFDEPAEACFVQGPVVPERCDEGGENTGEEGILRK